MVVLGELIAAALNTLTLRGLAGRENCRDANDTAYYGGNGDCSS